MPRSSTNALRRGRRRVALSAVVSAALVTTALAVSSPGSARAGDPAPPPEPAGAAHVDPPGAAPHDHAPAAPVQAATDGHGHSHGDPATKNALSRATESGPGTADPTTREQRLAGAAYVAAQRRLPDPRLRGARVAQPRRLHPQDRYAMANGCYELAGEPVYFKATRLGRYLLQDAQRRLLGHDGDRADEPAPAVEWRARKDGRRFSFRNAEGTLRLDGRSRFRLTRTTGCTAYPESQIGVVGRPHAGVTRYQEVRGYVDAHTHGMAFEFLGGEAHCGKPWDRYGAPYALVDCEDHRATGGYGGVLENLLSGEAGHDPVGWPTFKDWPAPDSLTHEGTYYRWLERSWRGGQRLFVNLLVENNQLCMIYPFKRNSCDDMDSVRLQAKQMYRMQDYIDAQFGGPGKGFYRIVRTPFQARRVINAGKMAVVMGIETSVPFGCTMKVDVPQCTAEEIDRQLDEVHRMGVRQMELVNKFDNALSGVAGDEGEVGVAVNSANFAETGSYWDMEHCEPADGESHDRNQVAVPDISAGQQDALFGAIASLGLPNVAVPVYPPPDHCNSRGLTALGKHTLDGLVERGMLFDPDHMSVKARKASLRHLEKAGYAGVLSSHSWSTPDAYPRIIRAGGFVAPYAGDSTGFVAKWRRHLGWADPRYYWGIGFGADINGLGAQGSPRGADVANPVRYPFRGLGGVRIERQHAGKRVYDINVDGVAQYGLYPDWVEDLTKVAGRRGGAIAQDMARGTEAYLQTWERAVGIAPDACRNPRLRQPVAAVRSLVRRGMTTTQVMRALGQPWQRLGTAYRTCATRAGDPRVDVTVRFDRRGRVTGLRVG